MTNINPETGEILMDEYGREIPDPHPMEIPLGHKRPETLAEQVQRLVRHSVSAYAALHGHETFAESEDFDVEDDFDPSTPYEEEFDPVLGRDLTPAHFLNPETREALKNEYLAAERNAIRAEARQTAIDEAFKRSKRPPQPEPSKNAPSPPPSPAEPLS